MNKKIVKGYFQPVKDRLNDVMLIRVPCGPCDRWHTHGDGATGDERTPVHELTHRSEHCVNRDHHPGGYWISIQPEPYDPAWATDRGRISKAYQA
jgi:hypothetical protein